MALQHLLHPAQVSRHFWCTELGLTGFKVLRELRQFRPGRANHIQRRALVALDVLRQIGGSQPAAPDHRSRVHLLQVREYAQQRGVAGAVVPDEADPRSRSYFHLQAAQHGPSPVELLDGTELDQGHALLAPHVALVFTRRMMTPIRTRCIT